MFAAHLLLLLAVVAALAAVTTAAYLQPDPLQVVVTTLEDFTTNQTALLAEHLSTVTRLLNTQTTVLTRLAAFLDAEEGRGSRLSACLEDPTTC